MKRMIHGDRAKLILETAVELAKGQHYLTLKRSEVAKAVDCTPALITFYFKDMTLLRLRIVEKALDDNIHTIIAQAITSRHPAVHGLTLKQKRKSLRLANC